jgi:hypothetical protein
MRRRDLKMGLETNIYKAFEKNLKYIDNDGKEVNPLNDSDKGKAKVEELSKDLSLAIKDFIVAQTFSIKKMEASVITQPLPVATPTGPGTLLPTKLTVSVKAQKLGPASMNPGAGVESMTSEIGIEEMDIMELV